MAASHEPEDEPVAGEELVVSQASEPPTEAPEESIASLGKEVRRLAAAVRRLREEIQGTDGVAAKLSRVEEMTENLLRLQVIDPKQLPLPQRLTAQRYHLHSQRAEDGLLQAIFGEAGVGQRRFVELGCGWNGGNSGFLVEELGWSGLMVDGSEQIVQALRRRWRPRGIEVKQLWLRREDVDDHLRRWRYDGEVDLLSIDVDGNDLWLWEAIESCRPRVVTIEYNTAFGAEKPVAVAYDPDFRRDKSLLAGLWYGASLPALVRLGRRKGYRLVACENVNAFFLRDDLARRKLPEVPLEQAWRLYEKDARRLDVLGADLPVAMRRAGLEFVEVE